MQLITGRLIEKGMNEAWLAKTLGVTLATVQNWQAERTYPSPTRAHELARILGGAPSEYLRPATTAEQRIRHALECASALARVVQHNAKYPAQARPLHEQHNRAKRTEEAIEVALRGLASISQRRVDKVDADYEMTREETVAETLRRC